MIPANDNSGTAHPVYECGDLTDPGMSLRDRFAMAAMQGDWASQSESSGHFMIDARVADLKGRASLYYRMADAMLVVRSEV